MSGPWTPPPAWGNYTLRDIVEVPAIDPISLWPATAAWWWPVGLVLIITITGTWRAVQNHRRNRYRRAALARLTTLRTAEEHGNTWPNLPLLLKATAIHAYGRAAVASLYGEEWLEFLCRKVPTAGFDGPVGQALIEIDYLPRERWPTASRYSDELYAACASWIREHPLPDPNSAP